MDWRLAGYEAKLTVVRIVSDPSTLLRRPLSSIATGGILINPGAPAPGAFSVPTCAAAGRPIT